MKKEVQWHSFAEKKPVWNQLMFVKGRIFDKNFMARYKGEYQSRPEYSPNYIKLTPITEVCEQKDVHFSEYNYEEVFWISAHEIADYL